MPGHRRPGAPPHDPQQPTALVVIDLPNLDPLSPSPKCGKSARKRDSPPTGPTLPATALDTRHPEAKISGGYGLADIECHEAQRRAEASCRGEVQ